MKISRLIYPVACIGFFNSVHAQEKPNFLWLTYEDTSPQFIGCYGNNAAKTPCMDSLANSDGGVRFEHAYSNSTVSSPSRSCIITGMDVNVLGTNNHRIECQIPATVKGFPYYLRQAGYYTSNNYKTDYNISNSSFIGDTWDESSNKAHWRKRQNVDQPFFSVFNLFSSHQSYVSRNDYSSYLTDIFSKLNDDRITLPDDAIIPEFYNNTPETHLSMARVQNCINYTDQVFQEYVDQLKADGLDDNTIIFCFSDHGEGIPRGKTCAIGMGYRVPFIVWFPEKWRHLNPFKSQIITERQICFEDLAPTILSLAGVDVPEQMKGTPIFDTGDTGETYIHGSRNRIDDSPGIDRTVIKGKYVYTRTFCPALPLVRHQGYAYNSDLLVAIRRDLDSKALTGVKAEPYLPSKVEYLYDLDADKWEMNNLAGNSEYASLLAEMRSEMVRYAKSIKDLGFIPEYEVRRQREETLSVDLRNEYDFEEIVNTAMLVGENGVFDTLMTKLTSDNPIVRYWAAMGIYSQGEEAVSHKDEIINAYVNEAFEGAKLKLAAFLYKYCGYEPAYKTIEEYAKGDDNILANNAVLAIQDMGVKIFDFKDFIDEIKPLWQENDNNYCVSPAVNVTKLLIRDALESTYSDSIVCDKNVVIGNYLTGGQMAVNDDGSIYQTYLDDSDRMWKLKDNHDGYFAIINSSTGKALTIDGSVNGVHPVLNDYEPCDAQLWDLFQYRHGYLLRNKKTGKYLQVNGQSKLENAVVAQWDWNGKQHFIWQFDDNSGESTVSTTNVACNCSIINACLKDCKLSVNLQSSSSSPVLFRLYDLQGQCVMDNLESEIHIGVNNLNFDISKSNVGKGVLILEVRQNNGDGIVRSIRKFIG